MRTDSTHLSSEALTEARNYVSRNIGAEYLPEKAQVYASKKGAQQAHEAVRPTDVDLAPADIKSLLTDEQFKLYNLLWRRFVACQMKPAKWAVTNAEITAQTGAGRYTYRATGRVSIFDGFTKVWPTSNEQQPLLPKLAEGQQLAAVDIQAQQHFTKPPARYTEASLIKTLEKEGIGRPSTYAPIISTVQDRGYVEQIEKRFYATDLGEVVTDKLNEYFPKIMDVSFTRYMEAQLDEIAEKHLDWVQVLREFYGPFKKSLDAATSNMKHAKAETTPSEYKCPDCGRPLVYRFGKNGKFLSCSDYPNCKFGCPCDRDGKMLEVHESEHECPACRKKLVYRTGRYGQFLGCAGYPDCKTVFGLDADGNILPPSPMAEPTGLKCYKCRQGELVIRYGKRGPFMGCNRFPKCRTIISIKQLDNLKSLQEKGQWPPKTIEQADQILGRSKTGRSKPPKKAKVKSAD